MAEQFETPPVTPFKYELVEDDTDNLKTVDATPNQACSWIDPASLNLKHRIGRGPFGDVWLATHHQSANDYDEFHEVAVKMLPPVKDESVQLILKKFEDLFFKIRPLCGVGWLHGVSVLQEKICIVMKFYEKSLSDHMAHIKGGKLRVSDILRYGAELARGILELHSIGFLLLNLKPSNFLLDDHDHVFLGDFGIPNLLHEVPLADPDMVLRLGTPNYMAPEQWEPEVRGPMMLETDSWGFGCSIVELLSGTQPWCGRAVAEIYRAVLFRQEQPCIIPSGLPHAIEDVIRGCFEYDPRNRPSMKDILRIFESFKDAVYDDEESVGIQAKSSRQTSSTCWYLLKDRIKVGDEVRSRKPLNGSKPRTLDVPEGSVVELQTDGENESFALVKIARLHNVLRVRVSTLERVAFGFAAGDWVRLKDNHSSLGILHSVHRNGDITVGFVGLSTLWKGKCSEIEKVEGFYVGQFVRVKDHVVGPRFEWPRRRNATWATGRVSKVLPNGCLVVSFPGRFVFEDGENSFLADPAEVGSVTFGSCDGLVKKYGHLEDFHWSVRPIVVAVGVLTAVKIGFSMKRNNKGCKNSVQSSNQTRDSCQGGGGRYIVPWLPPPVANILFGDGESIRV